MMMSINPGPHHAENHSKLRTKRVPEKRHNSQNGKRGTLTFSNSLILTTWKRTIWYLWGTMGEAL